MDVADANALAEGDFPGVGLLFRAEDGEESGFACAVRTDEADAIAVVDCAGDVVEERSSAEAFGDILRDQDRRHIFSLRGGDLARAQLKDCPSAKRMAHWARTGVSRRLSGASNARKPEAGLTPIQ